MELSKSLRHSFFGNTQDPLRNKKNREEGGGGSARGPEFVKDIEREVDSIFPFSLNNSLS